MFLSVQSQSGGVLLLWLQLQESVMHMWPPEDSCSRTFSFLLSRLTVASYSFSCTLVRYSNSQIACCTVHCGCAAVALIHLFIIHFSINRCTDSCLSDSASDVSPSEKTRHYLNFKSQIVKLTFCVGRPCWSRWLLSLSPQPCESF